MTADPHRDREPRGAAALVVAAGRGARFGAGPPKQYRPLRGETVLARAVRAFLEHPAIDRVHVVIRPEDRALYEAAVGALTLPAPIFGGATRRESALCGLEALAADPPLYVAIHDAARPLVAAAAIARVLAALADGGPALAGAIAAAPIRDTVKRVARGEAVETLPRDSLWLAQTPQAFRFAAILAAHRAAESAPDGGAVLTDDAAVAERAGLRVAAVACDEDNPKITTEGDLARAARPPPGGIRVGSGFDAHRFASGGGRVALCGVTVPHDRGLAGHSDADAALHAVTDALLGAVAAGDIGAFFPSDDAQWAGADSARFVRLARDIAARAGGRIAHIDVTIICERPRIAPHRAAMRARLAEILELPESAVSVKATSTDGLGFSGRGEGLAAQATATVEMAG